MKINVLIPLIAIFLLLCLKEMNAQTDPIAEKLDQALGEILCDCKSAKLLAQTVKNVNYIGNSGISLLSQSRYCPEVAKILLERGANVNLQNHDGTTALFEATSVKSTELLKLLLNYGANIDLRDNDGNTALTTFAWSMDIDIMKAFLENGANPNLQDKWGQTALHKVTECRNSKIESVMILLDKGANPNLQDNDGRTALMNTSSCGSTEIVKLLLKKGANPNLLNNMGNSALMNCVCSKSKPETVRLLLENGANPNIQSNGYTALYMASITDGQEEVVELLKKSGAHDDSNTQKDNNTSLYYDPNWNDNSWFDKYTKYKALYEGDSEELVCNLRNKKYSEDFAKNIKKIILCNYVVDLNSGSKDAKYYESIISEARKDLIKKGYEVEVVWYNKSESQYKNSETIKKKPAREEVAIVEISAGCDSSSKKYSGTTNETVGVIKDSNGKTVAEYQAPSSYSYREYTYTTEVHMWVKPYYQKTEVRGFGYSYQSLRGYVFTRSLKWLLKDIPKRK